MATRADLMHRLATIPTEDLLHLLGDQAIFELASKYFQNDCNLQTESPNTSISIESASGPSTAESSKDKAKRPLNAFMAFRSYYLKLFPDVQQKSASGFLTSLWGQDPYRNRWTLIAKVYSFIRDEVGKTKIPLGKFLGVCCPVMGIIEPSVYLESLGWVIDDLDDGSQRLVQQEAAAISPTAFLGSQDFPNTEADLLSSLLEMGYLPEASHDLMEKLNSNSNKVMATGHSSNHSLASKSKKIDFIHTIQHEPLQATKDLSAHHYDDEIMQHNGFKHHNVVDVHQINHISMEISTPEPIYNYQYATTYSHIDIDGCVFPFDEIADHEYFDIGNPFDMDRVMGYTQMEAERAAGFPDSPPYNAQEDFYYMF